MADPITYAELQKELVEEAQLLLGIALQTLGNPPDDPVPDDKIAAYRAAYQSDYHADAPSGLTEVIAKSTRRARVTC